MKSKTPAFVYLNGAHWNNVKAVLGDQEVSDFKLCLDDGHELTFEEVQTWLNRASEYMEQKAVVQPAHV